MSVLLDNNHYYVEIKRCAGIDKGVGRVLGYLLLDVSDLSKIIEPINIANKHECLKYVDVDNREDYRSLCSLLAEDRVNSSFTNMNINLVYNSREILRMGIVGNHIVIDKDLERGLDTFNINTEETEDTNDTIINNMEHKLNMLGVDMTNINRCGKYVSIVLNKKSAYTGYIKKLIDTSDTTRIICNKESVISKLDLNNDKIIELDLNLSKLCTITYDILRLPCSKVFLLRMNSKDIIIRVNRLEFNCNTWIFGYNTLLAIEDKIINSRYIKYIRHATIRFDNEADENILDLRGLEENLLLNDVNILNVDSLILGSKALMNINHTLTIVAKTVYSSNKDLDTKLMANKGGIKLGEIVYMRDTLEKDLNDFKELQLHNRFHRVATEGEREKYNRGY